MPIPDFHDVLRAQRMIRPYLPRTPLHRYPALDELIGTAVYIKHENYSLSAPSKFVAASTSSPSCLQQSASGG